MKRRHSDEPDEEARKRVKVPLAADFSGAELFDFPENQRYISSILHDDKANEKAGYIYGTIFMVYPNDSKVTRLVINTEESELGRKTVRVEVVFGKHCAKRLRKANVQLVAGRGLFISLQGCSLETGKSSNNAIGKVKFAERVLFKMVSQGRGDVVVDHWTRKLTFSQSAQS